MRIDKVNILNIFLFFSILASSQNNTRSPYSLNELGEINFLGNVSSVSMGGVESSLDSIEFNINNPSSLAKLKTTNYQIGTFYKSTGISNGTLTDRYNSANINYVAIGIPVKNFGFGFGVYHILRLDLAFNPQKVIMILILLDRVFFMQMEMLIEHFYPQVYH